MTAGLDLSGGIVSGHPVGIAVAVDGYDLSRLSDGVTFVDNETNLDARSLPVPAPSQEL